MSDQKVPVPKDKSKDKKKSSSKSVVPKGRHSFYVNKIKFIVDAKYSPIKFLGGGAYGVVCSALDKSCNEKIAIKKVNSAFDDLIDAKRILREIKLLRHFSHENIIVLRDMIEPRSGEPFEDVYMVFDYMETDLHKIINSRNDLTNEHIQYFIYQILKGLKYIHSANVIHRDLKPGNILLNSNCDLKICDFGLSRGVKEDSSYLLTEYVVTRWYRAPEVMCSCQHYDNKIDVWSVGCILGELLGRKPLFPGDNYIEQMNLMFAVIGTPTADDLKMVSNDQALEYIKALPKKEPVPFKNKYKNADPQALDLLEKMLKFDPTKRISVDDALKHPYLDHLHDPPTETECKKPFNFEFEKVTMTKKILQDMMWEEICYYRPKLKQKREKARKAAAAAAAEAKSGK